MRYKELIKNLKRLKNLEVGGRPQESWLVSSKEILMSQIQPQPPKEILVEDNAIYYWQYFSGRFGLLLKPALAVFLMVAVMFGYAATVGLADDSLPGDVFYPVKTASEKFQLALTFPEDKNVQLQMDFVNRRVDELQKIAAQDNNKVAKARKVSETAKQISKDVKIVKEKLNKISAASVPKTNITQVAKNINTQTLEAGQVLVDTAATLPTDVKGEAADDMREAIKDIEETGTAALAVIVKNYESGDSKISDNEVTAQVKNLEKIQPSKDAVAEVITGKPAISETQSKDKIKIQGFIMLTTSTNTLLNGYLKTDPTSSTAQMSETTNSLVQ
ncbi:hypothetical protein HZA71_00960 [Candidatus Falkowbacteria bacterium]|nr:hypothetical protein [Candidatus Falkowbacteria bacterium]